MNANGFQFTLTGPPASYTLFSTTDLDAWTMLATITNVVGRVQFRDDSSENLQQRFYRALAVP